jgi:hypothetical protein
MSMVVVAKSRGTTNPPPTNNNDTTNNNNTTTTSDTTTTTTPTATTPPADTGTSAPTTFDSRRVPIRCVVPRLRGLTLKQAKAKLKKAHCSLGKVTKKSSSKRKGLVIAQKPKAGTRGRFGLHVAVVLSRGR